MEHIICSNVTSYQKEYLILSQIGMTSEGNTLESPGYPSLFVTFQCHHKTEVIFVDFKKALILCPHRRLTVKQSYLKVYRLF